MDYSEKPLGVERVPDSTLISEIGVIQEGGVTVQTKEDLSRLVEPPLLEACEELYDKNIQTVMSSANSKDVEIGHGYIDVDFDLLSPENQQIALTFGEPFLMHGPEPRSQCVKLEFPIDNTTTVGDVRRMVHEAVSKFKPQEKIVAAPRKDPFENIVQTTEELIGEIPAIKSALELWQQELHNTENASTPDLAYVEQIRRTIAEYEDEIKKREALSQEA